MYLGKLYFFMNLLNIVFTIIANIMQELSMSAKRYLEKPR